MLEVPITRERLADPLLRHDDKAGAVSQTPVLVGSILVELPALSEPVRVDVEDRDLPRGKDRVQESDRGVTQRRAGETVSDLGKDRVGRDVVHTSGEESLIQVYRAHVEAVALVGQSEPGARVHEHLQSGGAHLAGSP